MVDNQKNVPHRRGILLAGGQATRLYPTSKSCSKHLLPVYDKPMIYYSLSLLMLSGITEVFIIVKSDDLVQYQRLLNDGRHLGMQISYGIQDQANGIPEALILAEDFIQGYPVCLVLGDNILFGSGLQTQLSEASNSKLNTIFTQNVKDPQRFGIVHRENDKIKKIIEKPNFPCGTEAVLGVYFLDNEACKLAKLLAPSGRNETEIVDLLNLVNEKKNLDVKQLTRGAVWFDAGTPDALLEASNFIAAVQSRQNSKIACLEEIALRMDFIDSEFFWELISELPHGNYRDYLEQIHD